MPIRWSPSTGAFYHADIHGDAIPADAVRISEKRHAVLLEGRAAGRDVIPGGNGKPILAPIVPIDITRLRGGVANDVKREARRRILAIASLERQSNDNAEIALACLSGGPAACAGALARRAEINAVRAASNAIEATIAASSAEALSRFSAADDSLWPTKDS